MKRLIILGNGFDLAHGLKTSFKDFIADYFVNAINEFYKNDTYSDLLLGISFKFSSYTWGENNKKVDADKVFETLSDFQNSNDGVHINFKSALLKNLYKNVKNGKWVDIEMEFFKRLLVVKRSNGGGLNQLNDQLSYIKDRLVKYLTSQQNQFENNFQNTPMLDCFRENISKDEVLKVKDFKTQKPENLCFLNFNYTNTFETYYRICDSYIPSQFNYIHGSLDGKYGDPIFGFGDEFDKEYLEFEEMNDNGYFKHIKSFEYSLAQNYHSLMRFIDSGDFQVHIYGHSCGLSDRTMLNTIFENDHCKSIKIFYYGSDEKNNDFIDKTYDIYRHFKDKALVRDKLVNRKICRAMPQPHKEYELSKS